MSQHPARPYGRVPDFEPIRAGRRRGRHRLRRLVRVRRRSLAAGLAVSAAALVATVPRGGDPVGGSTERAPAPAGQARSGPQREAETVSVPVRIADAAAVRLVHRGDRVDVIAAPTGRGHGSVPGSLSGSGPGGGPGGGSGGGSGEGTADGSVGGSGEGFTGGSREGSARVIARRARVERVPETEGPGGRAGALLLLSVDRRTAADLAGAGMASSLAVTLC